jgi:glycine/serine hydroxymethyltransferase
MTTTITPPARRWVMPGGNRVDLIHNADMSRPRRAVRRDSHLDTDATEAGGLVAGGYWMKVTHPSGIVISETHLGLAYPDDAMIAAIAAEGYEVTGLPRPPRR